MKKLLMAFCALFASVLWADDSVGLTGTDIDDNPMPRVALASWQDASIDPVASWSNWPTVGGGCIVCQPPSGSGGPGQSHDIEGKILPSLRPWSDCSSYGWLRNQSRYLTSGNHFDVDGPTGLNYVTWIWPWELAKTREPFYRGWDLVPISGCSERGTRIAGPIWLHSEVPFNPVNLDVNWYTTDVEGWWETPLFSAVKYGFENFSENFIGYNWGPDGIRNTPDDEKFTSGPARPVNEVYYTGVWGGTELSLTALEKRLGNECFFIVFRYWVVENGITRFDQTVRVSVGQTFSGWVNVAVAQSEYPGWVKLGLDPGGMRGFLYQSFDLETWEIVSPEPFDPGWYYIKAPKGTQMFYRLWPDIYLE